MEIKKREEAVERNYAKNNEMSKSDLKKSTPNKWLIASAAGVATLFYANPRSIFGSIGVVFGCIPTTKFTPLGEQLNSLSSALPSFGIIFGVVALIMGGISIIRVIGIAFNEEGEEKERLKKLLKSDLRIMIFFIVLVVLVYAFFFAWEYWLSNLPYFIETSSNKSPDGSLGYFSPV